jgi:fumarate reductase flavoprotein subunit
VEIEDPDAIVSLVEADTEGRIMDSFNEQNITTEETGALSRRGFLKGGIAVGAAAALGSTALAACTPSGGSSSSSSSSATADVDKLLPEAAPIAPVDPPSSWDMEADVVIVGMGGGGIAAATYLAQNGKTVIAVEKEGTVGGATHHAAAFCNLYGGAKEQNEKGFGIPVFPLDPDRYYREYNEAHRFTVDQDLLLNLINQSGEAADFILEQPGVDMVCLGGKWQDREIVEGGQYVVLGQDNTVNAMEKLRLMQVPKFSPPPSAKLSCSTESVFKVSRLAAQTAKRNSSRATRASSSALVVSA